MKNLSSILLGIFCLALAGLTFSSCRGNEGGEEEIKPDYDSSISVWYKEFENIKDYGIFGYYTWGYNHLIPELKLTDYTYKGIYDTPEKLAQLREAIFSDNTYVPVYRNGLETFSLETWDQIMERNAANVNRDVKIAKIDSLLKTNPEVVELHWTYNDNLSFTTHALVTPFAINYDNILWNLIYGFGIRSTNPADLQRNVLRTKSSSENDEDEEDDEINIDGMAERKSHTDKHELFMNISGGYTLKLSISCTLSATLQDDESKPYYGEYEVSSRKYETENNNYNGSGYVTFVDYHETRFYTGVAGSVNYYFAMGIAEREKDTNNDGEYDENDVNPNVYYSGSDYTFVGVFEKKTKGFNAITPSMF